MTKTEKFNFVANRASCSKYEFISVTEMWNMWNLWELFYFHYSPPPSRPDTCSTIIVKLRVNMGSESAYTQSTTFPLQAPTKAQEIHVQHHIFSLLQRIDEHCISSTWSLFIMCRIWWSFFFVRCHQFISRVHGGWGSMKYQVYWNGMNDKISLMISRLIQSL